MGFPEDVLTTDEQLLLHTRTHWKRMIVSILLSVLVLAVVFFVASLFSLPFWVWALIVVVGVGVILLPKLLSWWTSTYTITDKRIITRSGLFTQVGREIPIRRVSGVSHEKDLLDRVFGCGSLKVESSAEVTSVVFNDVPNVEEVQRMLSELIAAQPGS
jgi:uncharacterized membrane protein YdbT with pleckstrin-like domain